MKNIQDLIDAELQRARTKFPKPLSSPHEGFAVLLEEIEELDEETDLLRVYKDTLWKNVKSDNLSEQKGNLISMKTIVNNLIKEAIQVGAMIEKYQQDVLL